MLTVWSFSYGLFCFVSWMWLFLLILVLNMQWCMTLIQMSKLATSSAVSLSYSQSQRMQTSEGWVTGPTRWKKCFPVLCFEFVSSQRPREAHFQLSCQLSFPRCCSLQSGSGQSAHGGLHAWEATQANDKGGDSNEKQNCSLETRETEWTFIFCFERARLSSVHARFVSECVGFFCKLCQMNSVWNTIRGHSAWLRVLHTHLEGLVCFSSYQVFFLLRLWGWEWLRSQSNSTPRFCFRRFL